ncbi:MAG: Ig-like domain-containing protein [Candidatus Hinthialibacter antarcticus]|nr:Ig-like domain-containing protein [Candidatus Hinthialibacter antarcticus]
MKTLKMNWVMVVLGLAVLFAGGVQAQVPIVFQDGLGGYDGTHDTFFMTGDPVAINFELEEWEWDGSDAGGFNFGFLRFDDIVGTNPGQVPPDSTIIEAFITLNVTNEGDATQIATMHDLIIPFNEESDLIDFGDGFEPRSGIDYTETPLHDIPGPSAGVVLELDVTETIKKVQTGSDNLGWIFIPGGSNGVGITASEAAANRPKLTVVIEGGAPPDATRTIANTIYVAGGSIAIEVAVVLESGTQDVVIVETLPSGWAASGISNGGSFAAGAVTWNLSGFSGSSTLSYTATAPASPAAEASFSGTVNESFFIFGDTSAFLLTLNPLGEFEGHADIGENDAAGSATFTDGIYEVKGSGADIWGSGDEFHFVYKRIDGSFKISAKVDGFNETSTNEWSKIGLMIRENLDDGAKNYMSLIRGSDLQFRTQWRPASGASSAGATLVPVDFQDGQMEIIRNGDTFQSFYRDVNTGELVLDNTLNIDMANEVLVGLGVTSHEDGTLSVGTFENLAIELFSFDVSRNIPADTFSSSQALTGVKLTASVREGESPNLSITETPPSGWMPSNVQTSAGSATVNGDGSITWTVNSAAGSPTLTYDVQPVAGDIVGQWGGSATDGSASLPVVGETAIDAIPPLFETGNVLAVGAWNDSNTSSDMAVTAELVDSNGVIYVQDSSADGGWPSGTQFNWKTVLFADGFGAEEPGWQLRGFDDSDWIKEDGLGFTVGHGGNDAENGEIPLDASEETVYTRSIFDAQDYDNITSITIRVAGDDEAVVWLNGVFIGFTASGTSDRGESARDYVFDTTISGGSGGLENGSNPTDYIGGGAAEFVINVDLVDSDNVSVPDWALY